MDILLPDHTFAGANQLFLLLWKSSTRSLGVSFVVTSPDMEGGCNGYPYFSLNPLSLRLLLIPLCSFALSLLSRLSPITLS